MSDLKQALYRLSMAGAELEQQVTGDDLCDLAKAQDLADFIHKFKKVAGLAYDSLEVPEETFVYAKHKIDDLDEDGELAELINKLTEATDEPADGPGRDYIGIV